LNEKKCIKRNIKMKKDNKSLKNINLKSNKSKIIDNEKINQKVSTKKNSQKSFGFCTQNF